MDGIKHKFYIPYILNSDSISNNPINRPKKRGEKKKKFEEGLAIQKEHEKCLLITTINNKYHIKKRKKNHINYVKL